MSEELHNIPIEPELEARIVALVLGEASDFEAEELNRLVALRPELAAFKLQMEQIHGSLKHVSTGELETPEAEWKLPAERRSVVMAAIRGEATHVSAAAQAAAETGQATLGAESVVGIEGRSNQGVTASADSGTKPGSAWLTSRLRNLFANSVAPLASVAARRLGKPQLKLAAAVCVAGCIGLTTLVRFLQRDFPSNGGYSAVAYSEGMAASTDRSSIKLPAANYDQALRFGFSREPASGPTGVAGIEVQENAIVDSERFGGATASTQALSSLRQTLSRQDLSANSEGTTFTSGSDNNVNVDLPSVALREPSFEAPREAIVGEEDRTIAAIDLPMEGNWNGALDAGTKQNAFIAQGGPVTAPAMIDGLQLGGDAAPAEGRRELAELGSGNSPSGILSLQDGAGRGNIARDDDRYGTEAIRVETEAKIRIEPGDAERVNDGFGGGGRGGEMDGEKSSPEAGQKLSGDAVKNMTETFQNKEVDTPTDVAASDSSTLRSRGEAGRRSGASARSDGQPEVAKGFEGKASQPQSEAEVLGEVKKLGKQVKELSEQIDTSRELQAAGKSDGKEDAIHLGHRFQFVDDFDLPESKMPEGARPSEEAVTRSSRISVTEPEADIREGGADKSHPGEPSVVKDMPDDTVLQLEQPENSPAKPFSVSGKDGVVLSESDSESEVLLDLQKSLKSEIVARNKVDSDTKPSRAVRPSLGRVSNDERKAVSAPMAPPAGLNETNTAVEAFSTFSLHVSDVSFKLASAALAKGEWPEASKIRIEEFVNAFDYGDPLPGKNERVSCAVEQGIHPFLQQRNVLRVSMRTSAEGRAANTPLRLTFVLDNSGSMERADRQATVRKAFTLLSQQLTAIDQVTLISFSRQPRLLAENISGTEAGKLVQLVEQLPSEGGTNIEAALQLAFEKTASHKTPGAQHRIVLLTDGAVNLGNANPESLSRMVESMRESGIAFDAAGISADGLNDEVLEALTRKGDGRYYLMDSQEDADDSFVQQIAGALRPSASNVKVQVEFNPKRVGQYKLLGFEKHLLKQEDFRNDAVDAAEMAAAEAGVAMYQFEARPDGEGDVGSVSVRFRDLSTGEMVEHRWPIPYEPDAARPDQATPSLRIATAAAMLAAKLKGEALGETVDLQTLSRLIDGIPSHMQSNLRIQHLKAMIEQARQLDER